MSTALAKHSVWVGGDAQGDTFSGITDVIGSNYDDLLLGDSSGNRLDSGAGNDVISGGDGNDYIYGYISTATGPIIAATGGSQADQLYGGAGNDFIQTANADTGAKAYGGLGNDTIYVFSGEAYGDDGADALFGGGTGFYLEGGAGDDILQFNGYGGADGGEGGDTYRVNTSAQVLILDSGTSGTDHLYLNMINTYSDVYAERRGDDLYISSNADYADNGQFDSGAIVVGF